MGHSAAADHSGDSRPERSSSDKPFAWSAHARKTQQAGTITVRPQVRQGAPARRMRASLLTVEGDCVLRALALGIALFRTEQILDAIAVDVLHHVTGDLQGIEVFLGALTELFP